MTLQKSSAWLQGKRGNIKSFREGSERADQHLSVQYGFAGQAKKAGRHTHQTILWAGGGGTVQRSEDSEPEHATCSPLFYPSSLLTQTLARTEVGSTLFLQEPHSSSAVKTAAGTAIKNAGLHKVWDWSATRKQTRKHILFPSRITGFFFVKWRGRKREREKALLVLCCSLQLLLRAMANRAGESCFRCKTQFKWPTRYAAKQILAPLSLQPGGIWGLVVISQKTDGEKVSCKKQISVNIPANTLHEGH